MCYPGVMTGKRDTDKDLAFDIAMALSKAPLKQARGVDDLRVIAANVVKHLRLCRWQFERLPPLEPHGSFKREDALEK